MIRKAFISILVITIAIILFLFNYMTYYHRIKNTYISCNKVESITLVGGLSFRHWGVLQQDKDYEKIKKIVDLLNFCQDRAKATDREISSLDERVGYPVTLRIKLKNGDLIEVRHILYRYKSGDVYSVMMDKNKVIVVFERMGRTSFYTLRSQELVDYISKDAARDIPLSNS